MGVLVLAAAIYMLSEWSDDAAGVITRNGESVQDRLVDLYDRVESIASKSKQTATADGVTIKNAGHVLHKMTKSQYVNQCAREGGKYETSDDGFHLCRFDENVVVYATFPPGGKVKRYSLLIAIKPGEGSKLYDMGVEAYGEPDERGEQFGGRTFLWKDVGGGNSLTFVIYDRKAQYVVGQD